MHRICHKAAPTPGFKHKNSMGLILKGQNTRHGVKSHGCLRSVKISQMEC